MIPASWIPSLLDRMAAIYGAKFAQQWSSVPVADMHSMWAGALAPYDGERVKWALDSLIANNPWPPTLPEFVALVRQAPRKEEKALPAPEVPADVRAERAAELKEQAEKLAKGKKDHRKWARDIIANPKSYPAISLKLAREALCAAESVGG